MKHVRIGLALAPVVLASVFGCSAAGPSPTIGAPPSTEGTDSSVCVSSQHDLGVIDPNQSNMTLAGAYVYVRQFAESSATGGLSRLPIAGGTAETIDEGNVDAFAADDAGTVAWVKSSLAATQGGTPDAGSLYRRDVKNGMQTLLALPSKVTHVTALALDAAENIFVLATDSTGGNTVWRYSAQHDSFDLIHHNVAGLQGFYKDGDSVAWIGPAETGETALWREDVTGGTPTSGPVLPNPSVAIVGIDQASVYVRDGYSINAIDRTTSGMLSSINIPTGSDGAYPDASSVTMDDKSFYWVMRSSGQGGAEIYRAPKLTGQPTMVATADDLSTLSLGGCALAYAGITDAGDWGIIVTPK